MRKIFPSLAFAALCFIAAPSFAQKDSTACNHDMGLQDIVINMPKFDGAKWQHDLKQMTLLISGLEKEGLIDSKKSYILEVKRGELYIKGKKQPSEVTDKFRKYFTGNNYTLINED